MRRIIWENEGTPPESFGRNGKREDRDCIAWRGPK